VVGARQTVSERVAAPTGDDQLLHTPRSLTRGARRLRGGALGLIFLSLIQLAVGYDIT